MVKRYANIRKLEILLCIALIIFSIGFVARTGYRVIKNQQQYQKMLAEKRSLEEEIAALKLEVEELNDEDYVVRYARSHQIYTAEGEKAVKLPNHE
ncbi:MAG: FtsB family cell division protein [bacterium]